MAARVFWWMLMMAVLAVPAAAQPGDDGPKADSLGLAADAVPLPVQGAWAMDCSPSRLAVVRDSIDMRSFRHRARCDPSAFPGLGRELYVHVLWGGDCHARFGVEAYRSESRREYRVVMVTRFGRCRSGKSESRWVRLPPLPAGWTVAFTDRRLDPDDASPDTDSRGAAPDALPLEIQRESVDCRAEGFTVVRDTADARDLRRFPGCEPPAFPALGRHLYVRIPEGGFCGGRYTVRAYRSHARARSGWRG